MGVGAMTVFLSALFIAVMYTFYCGYMTWRIGGFLAFAYLMPREKLMWALWIMTFLAGVLVP